MNKTIANWVRKSPPIGFCIIKVSSIEVMGSYKLNNYNFIRNLRNKDTYQLHFIGKEIEMTERLHKFLYPKSIF